ncbi:MAG: hypothetical protein EA397_12415 [Deltaproteobacteria bacterium]|nr:MAG: hypothetical protein EA397_12415 [Deltaproteobacteria bacterium]
MHRRHVLLGLAALLGAMALPDLAHANPLPDADLQAEREALIAHVRDRLLGFDAIDLLDRVLTDLNFPRRERTIAELRGILGNKDVGRGFRSIQDLGDDGELMGALQGFLTRMTDPTSTKRWLLRLAKRIPADPAARQAMIEHLYTAWLGLDMDRLRAHVARYDREDLAIIYGPVTTLPEAAALVVHEPMALYLQLIHGRRAQECFLEGRSPRRELLRALLRPEISRVALIGHGAWSSFSLTGWYSTPTALRDHACDRLRAEPKEALLELAKPPFYFLRPLTFHRNSFAEDELSAAVAALYPSPARRAQVRKELIVRHTCGSSRYRYGEPKLAWAMLDGDEIDGLSMDNDGFSAARPQDRGRFEQAVEAWLADTAITPREGPAFGECLVEDPRATRGYEGGSWLADFLEDPVPAWSPAHPAWARSREAPAPPASADTP